MIRDMHNKLYNLRMSTGLTRKEVAEKIGISLPLMGFYETGERTPSLAVFKRLAIFYGVSTDYLLGLNTNPPNSVSLQGLTTKESMLIKEMVNCLLNKSAN